MDIFVYSDESGVFDKVHNQYFVFGGLMFLSKTDKDNMNRKYIAAEKAIRASNRFKKSDELKASLISNKEKGKLYRSINNVEKFGIVVQQKLLNDKTFANKKTKQRYLDWVYKYAVKQKFNDLISQQKIIPKEVKRIHFFIDEHTTATNGKYELKESLEQEFKNGNMNFEYQTFHPPLFENLVAVDLHFCNSNVNTLIRASDIVANKLYYHIYSNSMENLNTRNFHVVYHPSKIPEQIRL